MDFKDYRVQSLNGTTDNLKAIIFANSNFLAVGVRFLNSSDNRSSWTSSNSVSNTCAVTFTE
jgi:hypothetical protein